MREPSLAAIEAAEFWDLSLCLDCGEAQGETRGPGAPCDVCGSADVLPARLILKAATFVEEGGDDE